VSTQSNTVANNNLTPKEKKAICEKYFHQRTGEVKHQNIKGVLIKILKLDPELGDTITWRHAKEILIVGPINANNIFVSYDSPQEYHYSYINDDTYFRIVPLELIPALCKQFKITEKI
jgi:hypothetical protein